jgi:hypothetical protein
LSDIDNGKFPAILQLRNQKESPEMRNYFAFYKNQRIVVMAATSYAAQLAAAKVFKARKSYDVAIVLADIEIDPASL